MRKAGNDGKHTDIVPIRPLSDASMFWGNEMVCLVEIDSHNDRRDFSRMLVQAAFYVRFVKLTLKITEFCLPVIFISDQSTTMDQWAGEIYLVYECTPNVCFSMSFESRN